MGSLESAILDAMWSADTALKPGEVLQKLDIKPAVSYSTVLTILRRLWKKDLVSRKKDGKAYRYTPKRSREEQVALSMTQTFSAASDPAVALGHFVANLSAEDATALRELLGDNS